MLKQNLFRLSYYLLIYQGNISGGETGGEGGYSSLKRKVSES